MDSRTQLLDVETLLYYGLFNVMTYNRDVFPVSTMLCII